MADLGVGGEGTATLHLNLVVLVGPPLVLPETNQLTPECWVVTELPAPSQITTPTQP